MNQTPDLFEVPESAIRAFETWSGLKVVVHDFLGQLRFFLPAERFFHSSPVCQAIKNSAAGERCLRFEITDLGKELGEWPAGRIHRCHAGLVEWVVPVFEGKKPRWIFFAGQRFAAAGAKDIFQDPGPSTSMAALVRREKIPKAFRNESKDLYLEGLRQLASRLEIWFSQHGHALVKNKQAPLTADLLSRKTVILQWVREHYREDLRLSGLAAILGLSPGRTAHAVKESCGKNLGLLLSETRIHAASSLLRHSELTVEKIAEACGFGEVRAFYRQFKKQTGMSPHDYRKSSELG